MAGGQIAETPAATEERWMVGSIVREIVRTAALASGEEQELLGVRPFSLQEKRDGQYMVDIHLRGGRLVRRRLAVGAGVWEPQTYAGLAGDLLHALGLRGHTRLPASEGPWFAQLQTPRVEVLLHNDARISGWLTREPLDPAAHEQAALLLGTLGLRENAGAFSDTRPVCNRIAAHLALAQALRGGGPSSLSGQMAALVRALLAGEGAACEVKIKALTVAAGHCPELRPWLLAAKFRNRQDWRLADGRQPGSLLERLEFFRALCTAASPEAGCTALTRRPFEDLPDWPRILLASDYQPAEARRFAPFALPFELDEIRTVFPRLASVPAQAPAFAEVLNQPSTGLVTGTPASGLAMRVLDDGLWAQYLQRHLCHALCQTERYQRVVRGQPQDGAAFAGAATAIFGQLRLFPEAAVLSGNLAWAGSAAPAAARLLRAQPEQVPAAVWAALRRQPGLNEGLPSPGRWYSPMLPAGTTCDFTARAQVLPALGHAGRPELERLHRLSPWHFEIAERLLRAQSAGRPTTRQFQEVLSPFVRYYRAAWQHYPELVRDQPETYIASLRQMADLYPELYATLGEYLALHQRPEEAADAHASLLARRVPLATLTESAAWLTDYYLDRHRPDKALAAARIAESGGLASGLLTMARLQERLEDLPAAEGLCQRVADVYEDPTPLLRFYQRHEAEVPVYHALLERELARLFPAGIVPSAAEQGAPPPIHGVAVLQGSPQVAAAGLRAQDVVVSVNGRQAASLEQYAYLRGESEAAPLDLVVYGAGGYRELRVTAEELPLSDLATWHR